MRFHRYLALGLGVVALALPASAAAHGKGKAVGHGKNHPVTYVFKGTYSGEGSVAVAHGNAHVRRAGLVGQTVQFDLTNARLKVADMNASGIADIGDVAVGDAVVVKARLPRNDPLTQPVGARQLVDQTNPPVESAGDDSNGSTTNDSGAVP